MSGHVCPKTGKLTQAKSLYDWSRNRCYIGFYKRIKSLGLQVMYRRCYAICGVIPITGKPTQATCVQVFKGLVQGSMLYIILQTQVGTWLIRMWHRYWTFLKQINQLKLDEVKSIQDQPLRSILSKILQEQIGTWVIRLQPRCQGVYILQQAS